jgi:hypothetical protein
MAEEEAPLWRQSFDAIERELGPRLEAFIRTDQFAAAVGAAAHLRRMLQQQAARSTRRMLHLMNLPAGTDVARILSELGQLRQQVRDLSNRVEPTKESTDGRPARPVRAARTRPS